VPLERGLFGRRLLGGAAAPAEGLADGLVAAIEQRSLWARFGL
jgi:hypothetical protein